MDQAPTPQPGPAPQRAAIRQQVSVRSVAIVVGVTVLLIFILQNTEDVTFHFLTANFSWPMWLYTIVVALVGAMVWFGLGVVRRHLQRRRDHLDTEAG